MNFKTLFRSVTGTQTVIFAATAAMVLSLPLAASARRPAKRTAPSARARAPQRAAPSVKRSNTRRAPSTVRRGSANAGRPGATARPRAQRPVRPGDREIKSNRVPGRAAPSAKGSARTPTRPSRAPQRPTTRRAPQKAPTGRPGFKRNTSNGRKFKPKAGAPRAKR